MRSRSDYNYFVFVKKCFHLKNGDVKTSVSRFRFVTYKGALRCLYRMRSRSDVIEAYIE